MPGIFWNSQILLQLRSRICACQAFCPAYDIVWQLTLVQMHWKVSPLRQNLHEFNSTSCRHSPPPDIMVALTLSCFSSSSFEYVTAFKSDVFRRICHFVYTHADEKLANKKSSVCHEKLCWPTSVARLSPAVGCQLLLITNRNWHT